MKALLLALAVSAGVQTAHCGEILRIAGSAVVNRVVADAAKILRAEQDMEIQISTNGGSTGGIGALGAGEADIAMSSRPITPEDRAEYPDVNFKEVRIGAQVLALGVARNVWESGVRAVTSEQVRAIYEGRLQNWKELGGSDDKIAFYNWEEGNGTWELLTQWTYGSSRRAPLSRAPTVSADDEARNSIEFTRGAIAAISPLLIDGKNVFALAVKLPDGKTVEPIPANVLTGAYPVARPMILVINDRPTGDVKKFIEFVTSERCREIFKKHGYLHLGDFKAATDLSTP